MGDNRAKDQVRRGAWKQRSVRLQPIFNALLAVALLAPTLVFGLASDASAGLYGPIPANQAGDPTDTFVDDDALFVYVRSDIAGGRVCVVDGDLTDPAQGSCDAPAWGSANTVVGIGTIYTLMEGPTLPLGTFRILAENSVGQGTELSIPFTVRACADCDRTLADGVVAQWKSAAAKNLGGAEIVCTAMNLKEQLKQAAERITAKQSWDFGTNGVVVLSVSLLGTEVSFITPQEVIQTGQQKAIEILHDLTCTVQAMYADIVNDPPDPNFTTISEPEIGSVVDLSAAETNRLGDSLARHLGLGAASLTAYERYLGAADAGDPRWASAQLDRSSELTFELIDEIRETVSALEAYADFVDTLPELSVPVIDSSQAQADLAAAYQRISTTGFSADEYAQLTGLGFTDAEIQLLRAWFDVDPAQLAVGAPLSTFVREAATTLESSIPELDSFAREASAVAGRIALDIPNEPPVAVDDVLTTAEDEAGTVDVLANDSDATDPIQLVSISPAQRGSISCTGGSCTYTPAADFNGLDSFTYVVGDGRGGEDTGVVEITVTEVNDPPTATPDATVVAQDTSTLIDVVGNDSAGPSNESDQVVSVVRISSPPSSGAAQPEAGAVRYTAGSSPGTDSFEYEICDDGLTGGVADPLCAVATVDVTITEPNQTPEAIVSAVPETGLAPLDVSFDASGSSDPDGDGLTFAWDFGDGQTATGEAVVHRYGTAGVYQAAVTVTDDGGLSDVATVTIDVTSRPPTAFDRSFSTTLEKPASISLAASDPDGDALTYRVTSGPSNGVLSGGCAGTDRYCTYQADPGFTGVDTFTYVANDGYADSGEATVTITVNLNRPPTTFDRSYSTTLEKPVGVSLAASDPDRDDLTYRVTSGPSNGVLSGGCAGTDRTCTYQADPGFTGVDTFTYVANDGYADSGEATVTITVIPNRPPTARDSERSTIRDQALTVVLSAFDSDGDALTYRVTSGPSNGVLSGGCAGTDRTCTYQPDPGFTGVDTFTFVVNDGEFDSNEATVAINVVNQLPIPVDDVIQTSLGVPGSVDVLVNDSDPDGDSLILTGSTNGANGSVSCTAAGACTYVPGSDFAGIDTFTYNVDDGFGGTATGRVIVAVSSGLRVPADVVFAIDESGSMGGAIADVKANVSTIATLLEGGGLDARLGLVGYGAGSNHGGPAPHLHSVVADASVFDAALDELVTSGGVEPALDTTVFSMSDALGFRAGAGVCMVLITDEPTNGDTATSAEALAALQAREATFFAIGRPSSTKIVALADATGGASFDINDFGADPLPVLLSLLQSCAGSIVEGVTLLPASAENFVGETHTVTAVLRDSLAAPVVGSRVDFEILDGPHAGLTGTAVTNALGEAEFGYVGTTEGTDTIKASFTDSVTQEIRTATATKTWITDPNQPLDADVSVSLTGSPDPVTAGSSLTFSIVVANAGPSDASGVVVTDTLPAGVSPVSATPTQGACVESAGVVTCELGDVAAGATTSITIVVDVATTTPAGTLTNSVAVTSDIADPDVSNNAASEDTQVVGVPPVADAGGPYSAVEGTSVSLDASGSIDPDGGPLTYAWDLDDDGNFDDAIGPNAALAVTDGPAAITVAVRVTDADGLSDEDTAEVAVTNAPPQLAVSSAGQSVQYSDRLTPVMVTSIDVPADTPDQLELSHAVDGGGFVSGLPDGFAVSSATCAPGTVAECEWTLGGVAGVPAGIYTVRLVAVDDDGAASDPVDVVVTVVPEDVSVGFSEDNPLAVLVPEPGGDSGPLELDVTLTERDRPADVVGDDQLAGDITRAVVTVALVPVGPGSSVETSGTCAVTTSPGSVDPDSAHDYDVLTLSCPFSEVPVNTYTVDVNVNGAGFYEGDGEDVLTVYDPSLGHVTGGGWFYWPGTADPATGYAGDKTNFGLTMKYNRKGTNLRGNFLMIRHLPDGTIYRIKSNALDSLALGEEPTVPMGWAVFSGKGTFRDPTMLEPEGNYAFQVYVEDRNEPGQGNDRFWIELRDKDRVVIAESSIPSPAVATAVELGGGNIVAPHSAPISQR